MKRTRLAYWIGSALILCLVAVSHPAQAQIPTGIDVELRASPDGNAVEFYVRSHDINYEWAVNQFAYTLKWPASSTATLGTHELPCPGAIPWVQYWTETSGGYNYTLFVTTSGTNIDSPNGCPEQIWLADEWRMVHRIPIENNTGCTPFEIGEDDYTTAVYSTIYAALTGVEFCPVLHGCPNDINIITTPAYIGDPNGACAPDCEGTPGGPVGPGDPCGTDMVYDANCECVMVDCAGVAGGTAFIDQCEDCVGGTTGEEPCEQDCAGTWGGSAMVDDCNVCYEDGEDDPNWNTTCLDCHGDVNGDAYIDDCGVCVGGNTGMLPCGDDCAGIPGGTAFFDNCGECVGGTTGLEACEQDCNNVWGGSAFIDECGDCVGGNTGADPCEQDCLDVWGGPAMPGTACDPGEGYVPNSGTWNADCECVDGTPVTTYDCPAIEANVGDPCDAGEDYEPGTGVVTEDCECIGDPIGTVYDCPDIEANFGDPCEAPGTVPGSGVITNDCLCVGTPTGDNDQCVILELQTDANGNQTSWEILSDGTMDVMCDGAGYPNNSVVTNTCCLPVGCYLLRVYDSAGDGMASGTNGGYTLRLPGAFVDKFNPARIIDNRNNFLDGSESAIANNRGFCLPIGDDRLIFTSCDKLHWESNEFLVASLNPAVSAMWVPNAPNSQQDPNSGYQFWFFDPNGSYSFVWFRRHSNSHGFGTGAARAAHLRINNWIATYHIPENVLMNVRVRGVVNGTPFEWGPACRFMIDPAAAQCPPTKLIDIPWSQFLSCGQTREFASNSYVHAIPVSGASQYQFRFRQPAEGYEKVRTTSSYIAQLWWTMDPLVNGSQYEVDVRAMVGGAWCDWGEVCILNIDGPAAQGDGATQNMLSDASGAELNMWPNPNRGDQLWITLSEVPGDVLTVTVDMFDLFGKRVMARQIAVNDGFINTVMNFDGDLAAGVYMVNITAGDKLYTQRLVVQR